MPGCSDPLHSPGSGRRATPSIDRQLSGADNLTILMTVGFHPRVAGDPDVLKLLNEQLTSELTAINQYFLHSKMQDSWGLTELAKHTRAESFEEMEHAELLTDRILLLDGLPNYQRLFSLSVGQTLKEMFESDLAIEIAVVERLKPGIVMCRERQDSTSAALLERIMADEEHHVDYLKTQLDLIEKMGEPLYYAQCVSAPPT
ncbi:bacterioferritin [Geodermatophilus sp. URMC 63]